jgi:ABC-type multidrug transport system fused ATPase/permease subunit
MTSGEHTRFVALLIGRTLSGLLDLVGVALIGIIAAVGASQVSGNAGEPIVVAGVTLPFSGPYALVWLSVIVLAVFVGKSVLAVYLSRKLAFLIAGVEARNAAGIGRLLLHGSLNDSKKFSKAEYQFAVTGSATAAFTGLLNGFTIIVSEGFLLLLIVGAFFFVDPVAAIFALLYFAAVAVVIQLVIGRSLKRAGRDASEGSIDSANIISDSLDTFRELSVMGKQSLYLDRLFAARTKLSRSGATAAFLAGMPRYVVETALIVGVVALVAQQLATNGLVAGVTTLGVFLTGGMRIMASLLPLQNSVAQIKMNVEQSALAYEFLDLHHEELARATTPPVIDTSALGGHGLQVEISDVEFAYPGTDSKALADVSLRADRGQFVAIIGPSGAGKTTLVDLLLGLVPPSAGQVKLGGADPLDLRLAAPGIVSYVPQRPGIVSGTIAENIALGVPTAEIDRARLDEVVRAAFLEDFVFGLTEGVDTSVGKQVNSLSGGQIQRIGLARALYSRPQLLIMDEATSALDAGSEAFISESLRELHGQVTVIVIAHRLSTVQHADDVYVMEGGRVTARGDFQTLTATIPMVAEYVRLMSFDERPAA